MGRPAIFIRLAGCNLMCGGKGTEHDGKLHDGATWRCDTIEVWKHGEKLTIKELYDKLDRELGYSGLMRGGAHTIITGGEPLLQMKAVEEFIDHVRYNEQLSEGRFEIETNGTIIPSQLIEKEPIIWNVSPKMKNSGMSLTDALRPKAIEWFAANERSIFKIVVSNALDMTDIKDFITAFKIPNGKVWVMPAASNLIELLRRNRMVADFAMSNLYNFSTRLQVEIWDQTTGV